MWSQSVQQQPLFFDSCRPGLFFQKDPLRGFSQLTGFILLKWSLVCLVSTVPLVNKTISFARCVHFEVESGGSFVIWRSWIKEVTKNPMFTLTEHQKICADMEEVTGRSTISAALHQSALYGRELRQRSLWVIGIWQSTWFAICHLAVSWKSPSSQPDTLMCVSQETVMFNISQKPGMITVCTSALRAGSCGKQKKTLTA